MSKKYSSYDKNQLLCETFRKFALEENTWSEDQDPNLIDPPGRPEDEAEKDKWRNAGVNDQYISLSEVELNAVLGLVKKFLKSGEVQAKAEGLKGSKLTDALIAAGDVAYMEAKKGSWTELMHNFLYPDVEKLIDNGAAPATVSYALRNQGETP